MWLAKEELAGTRGFTMCRIFFIPVFTRNIFASFKPIFLDQSFLHPKFFTPKFLHFFTWKLSHFLHQNFCIFLTSKFKIIFYNKIFLFFTPKFLNFYTNFLHYNFCFLHHLYRCKISKILVLKGKPICV